MSLSKSLTSLKKYSGDKPGAFRAWKIVYGEGREQYLRQDSVKIIMATIIRELKESLPALLRHPVTAE
eukprot:scaffold3356_cov264-Pinguiococcus_pyrenoidosus.AAC.5